MATIPTNLQPHLADAFASGQHTTGIGKDPSVAFRNHTGVIDWDFEVDPLETQVEQGIIQENIKAAGALHYIQTLGEVCGVFRVTDAIVYRWATGSLDVPNDPDGDSTASKLYRYYKFREERTAIEERKLLYKRVLNRGDVKLMDKMQGNTEFTRLWKNLIYEFVRYIQKEEDNDSPERISRKPIYQAIQDLQYNLSASMTGMALIQTQEIYYQFKDCLDILRDSNIVAQLGNGYRRNMWTVIEKVSMEEFKSLPNISPLRTAAVEGQKIFKYVSLADDSILQQGSNLFEDLKHSVDLFVTAMGDRENMAQKQESMNPFQSNNPLFRNLPGMDNIGQGDNFMNGLMDSFLPKNGNMNVPPGGQGQDNQN